MVNADFSEKEVKDAIFGSYAEGAPGPDGFSFLFYQHFWELIRADFMDMVKDWNEGKLDLYRLNFSLLTLIPKETDAVIIHKFRPIALTNCSFKIFLNVPPIGWVWLVRNLSLLNKQLSLRGDTLLRVLFLPMKLFMMRFIGGNLALFSNLTMKRHMIGLIEISF
jgi:hypothetical protein